MAKCGSCHTLARANTKGIVGPNLDEAFRASVEEGLERSSVRGAVEGQIQLPNPEGAMPKDLVTGAKLKDIAAYVAQLWRRPARTRACWPPLSKLRAPASPRSRRPASSPIPASPSGQLAYVTSKATATAGAVTVEMANMSGVSHNIAVETGEGGASAKGTAVGASSFTTKGTVSVKVNLKPGTYTFFCQAPGHRAAGMYGTITVK